MSRKITRNARRILAGCIAAIALDVYFSPYSTGDVQRVIIQYAITRLELKDAAEISSLVNEIKTQNKSFCHPLDIKGFRIILLNKHGFATDIPIGHLYDGRRVYHLGWGCLCSRKLDAIVDKLAMSAPLEMREKISWVLE